MTNQTSNPSPEQLNDPEGQQLVQTIHERKELTGTLANTICNASNYPKRAQPHLLGSDMSHVINKTADSLLAAGYRKPYTATTKEEIEALTDGSIIRDSAGDVAEKRGGVWCSYETAPMSNERLAKYTPITVLHEGESK